jgi:hypothetical protein
VHDDLERVLTRELNHRGYPAAEILLGKLLYGEMPLVPAFARGNLDLMVVLARVIAEGARALHQIDSNILEDDPNLDEGVQEDYERWRNVYGEADRLGEVVLVLGC